MEVDNDRREFLKSVARVVAAPLVIGTVTALSSRSGERCTNQGICRGCGVVTTCGLPQALSFREATSKEGDGRQVSS